MGDDCVAFLLKFLIMWYLDYFQERVPEINASCNESHLQNRHTLSKIMYLETLLLTKYIFIVLQKLSKCDEMDSMHVYVINNTY